MGAAAAAATALATAAAPAAAAAPRRPPRRRAGRRRRAGHAATVMGYDGMGWNGMQCAADGRLARRSRDDGVTSTRRVCDVPRKQLLMYVSLEYIPITPPV